MSDSIQNPQQVIDGLVAQCDAAKQMHNEALNSNLQLRTHVNLIQKELQRSNEKSSALSTENAALKAELEALKCANGDAPVQESLDAA